MRLVNVEAALVAHLEPLLGVKVATEVPATRPDRFVRLYRIGGGSPLNMGVTRVPVMVGARPAGWRGRRRPTRGVRWPRSTSRTSRAGWP